jgi:hypothetical protein
MRLAGAATVESGCFAWQCLMKMRVYRQLFAIFTGLQVADVITTNSGLSVPGTWEANPVVAYAQAHLGEVWWLPKLAVVGFVFIAAPLTRRLWPMVFAVTYYAVIVGGNVAWAIR